MIAHEQEETWTAWDEISTGTDRFVTPSHRWRGNEGVRRASLEAGMYFLDVTAGNRR
jgi:hypothetical protein